MKLFDWAIAQMARYHIRGLDTVEIYNDVLEKLQDDGLAGMISKLDDLDELVQNIDRARKQVLLHTPSDVWTERIPTHRLVCNAALAHDCLSPVRNSRPMDRLAILANICQYPIRINTAKMQARDYDLSTCFFTQALVNGDLSFLASLKASVWSKESFSPGGFSWLPPPSTSLEPKSFLVGWRALHQFV